MARAQSPESNGSIYQTINIPPYIVIKSMYDRGAGWLFGIGKFINGLTVFEKTKNIMLRLKDLAVIVADKVMVISNFTRWILAMTGSLKILHKVMQDLPIAPLWGWIRNRFNSKEQEVLREYPKMISKAINIYTYL